jgi:hypothetical protein
MDQRGSTRQQGAAIDGAIIRVPSSPAGPPEDARGPLRTNWELRAEGTGRAGFTAATPMTDCATRGDCGSRRADQSQEMGRSCSPMRAMLASRVLFRSGSTAPTGPCRGWIRSAIPPASPCSGSAPRCGIDEPEAGARGPGLRLPACPAETLIISCVIILGAYGAMHSVWWTVRFASCVILYATFGVTLLVVRPIWWMIRSLARLGQDANNVQSSCARNAAAAFHGAIGHKAKSVSAAPPRSSCPDVASSVREASEALFAYERRMFTARSEIRETVTRTLETIAQTQAFMAHVDAVSRGVARSSSNVIQDQQHPHNHRASLVADCRENDPHAAHGIQGFRVTGFQNCH